MKSRRNYYRVLHIQPDAPFEIIRASYRTLMKELRVHPDLGGEHWNAKVLNEAYEVLSDPFQRGVYDIKLYEYYTKEPFSSKEPEKTPIIRVFCPFCKRPLARKASPNETCYTCSCPLESSDDEELEQKCRRSVVRIKKFGKIRFYSYWPQKGDDADIIDLSPKGMRFLSKKGLPNNIVIKVSGALLKAIAKVVECHRQKINGTIFYSVGVQFQTVTFAISSGSFVSASA